MKKRGLLILTAAMLSTVVVGCGNTDKKDDSIKETSTIETTVEFEAETEEDTEAEDGSVEETEPTSMADLTMEVTDESVTGETEAEEQMTLPEGACVMSGPASETMPPTEEVDDTPLMTKEEYPEFGKGYPRIDIIGEDEWTGKTIAADVYDKSLIEAGIALKDVFNTSEPGCTFDLVKYYNPEDGMVSFELVAPDGSPYYLSMAWSDTRCDLKLFKMKEGTNEAERSLLQTRLI